MITACLDRVYFVAVRMLHGSGVERNAAFVCMAFEDFRLAHLSLVARVGRLWIA
jgi:hypothetical protein